MTHRRMFVPVVGIIACVAFGCSGEDSGGEDNELTPEQRAERQVTSAVEKSAQQSLVLQQGIVNAIRLASDDFQVDLTTQPASEESIEPFTEMLEEIGYRADIRLASDYELIKLIGLSESLDQSQSALTRRRQALAGALILLGGVVLSSYAAKKGIDSAFDTATAGTKEKLESGNEAELDVARKVLGLPPDADREALLEKFNSAGSSRKLSYHKKLKAAWFEESEKNTDVQPLDTEKERKAFAKTSVKLGETGVNNLVSNATSLTGGQGTTEAFQLIGASKRTAQIADLTITAVSIATDQPLQPLDVFNSTLTVTVVSKEKQTVEVPEPEQQISLDKAASAVAKSGRESGNLQDAIRRLVRHAATATEAVVEEKPDGTMVVEVPARVHRTILQKPEQTTIEVPDMGKADVVVTATGHSPQVFEDVDISSNPTVEFKVDTDEEDPEPDDVDPGDEKLVDRCLALDDIEVSVGEVTGGDSYCFADIEFKNTGDDRIMLLLNWENSSVGSYWASEPLYLEAGKSRTLSTNAWAYSYDSEGELTSMLQVVKLTGIYFPPQNITEGRGECRTLLYEADSHEELAESLESKDLRPSNPCAE